MQSRLFFHKGWHIRPRGLISFIKHGCSRSFVTNLRIKGFNTPPSCGSFGAQRFRQLDSGYLLLVTNNPSQLRRMTVAQSASEQNTYKEDDTIENSLELAPLDSLSDGLVSADSVGDEYFITRTTRGFFHSRRYEKSRRVAPSVLLARYIDLSSLSGAVTRAQKDHISSILKNSAFNDLPAILLRYIICIEDAQSQTKALGAVLDHSTAEDLQKAGYSPNDVHMWATVVTAPTDVEAARRYLSMQCAKPAFLLLELLRRDRLSVEVFRLLLIDAWGLLLGKRFPAEKEHINSLVCAFVDNENTRNAVSLASSLQQVVKEGRLLEETAFTVLVNRLLRRARQIWPPAVVSISNMIALHFRRIAGEPSKQIRLKPNLHSRLSKMLNMFLYRLSIPSSFSSMDSMTYNWKAQRVLLELAGSFQPPLQLDRDSYRAVASVLIASPKSPKEAKFASLLRRSWPPWRKELDGMDVERSSNEDISRAVAAVSRMKEAGYPEEPIDRAIQILGGREPDGTPTIQTRSLIWKRRPKSFRMSAPKPSTQHEDIEWAARIRATRDIYEAWAAFTGYTASSHPPSNLVYEAMFEKLVFDHIAKAKGYHNIIMPGDGKEVMPVLDDNLSESEKRRLQPPTINELYSRMRRDGIRPSGRCLSLLLGQAKSIQGAFKYLQDGAALPPNATQTLLGSFMEMDVVSLMRIPEPIFVAFIKFLSQSKHSRLPYTPNNAQWRLSAETDIYNLRSRSELLLRAFELMKRRRCFSRPAWYALFGALARRGMELDNRKDQNRNDILSWQILKAAVYDSRHLGVQLDPAGFQIICIGLEKALLASSLVSDEDANYARTDHHVVKQIFVELSRSANSVFKLPQLLHKWGGSHVHAYVRVLGLCHDKDSILELLHWIARHQIKLKVDAEASNDTKLLRKCLVAIRVFFDHSEDIPNKAVNEMRTVVERLEEWGGWPTAEEVDEYQRKCNPII